MKKKMFGAVFATALLGSVLIGGTASADRGQSSHAPGDHGPGGKVCVIHDGAEIDVSMNSDHLAHGDDLCE